MGKVGWKIYIYIGCLRHFVFVFALNQQKKKMKEKKKKKECHIVTPRIMIEFAMITELVLLEVKR